MKKTIWNTRFGFYLAAIGSACGLGNLWRFPYVVGENGGGAFVLLYILLGLIVGVPLLIGELLLGKTQRKGVVQSLRSALSLDSNAGPRTVRSLSRFGIAGVIITLVVLSYYAVISGWVLHYLMKFISQFIHSSADQGEISFGLLMSNGSLQLALASVHVIVTSFFVLKGVEQGLEKIVAIVMPVFVLLLLLLGVQASLLPTFSDALRFFFYPDFSKLTWSVIVHALGHLCFTMSIGFGVMVTFGAHLAERVFVPSVAFRVMMIDTLLSIVSGVIVFSIALSASDVPLTDPGLLFSALPQFLLSIPGGAIFGVGFFLSFYLAALSASIGLLEGATSNIAEVKGWNRKKAVMVSSFVVLTISIAPAMSSSFLLNFRPFGKSILEFLDSFLINWCLPLIAVSIGWIYVNKIQKTRLKEAFIESSHPDSEVLFSYWIFSLQWMTPILLILAVMFHLIGVVRI